MRHTNQFGNRRHMIRSLLGGSLLMPGLLSELLADDDPMAAKQPHFPAKAKRVIFLYMTGGVSHVDSFDPKPKLTADHGKNISKSEKRTQYLVKSKFEWKPRGQCGTEVTDLFPHVAECVDDEAPHPPLLNAAEHVDDDAVDLELHRGGIDQVESASLRLLEVHS